MPDLTQPDKETAPSKHFFISYNKADRYWAEWIAWNLEDHGFRTLIQAWDFGAGANFVEEMDKATTETDHTVIVVSPDFVASEYCKSEWQAAYRADPTGKSRKLLPVRVRDCELKGILSGYSFIDLVGKDEAAARDELITGIQSAVDIVEKGRAKPGEKPRFPAGSFPETKDSDSRGEPAEAPGRSPQLRLDRVMGTKEQEIPASRAPIIIALEEQANKITEEELLHTERHMTVSLDQDQVDELESIAAELDGELEIEDMVDRGSDVWMILENAQPWLRNLMQCIRTSETPQPVAWTGRAELLTRLCRAVSLACLDFEDDVLNFITVGHGSHYFHPLTEPGSSRSMQKRQGHMGSARLKVHLSRFESERGDEDVVLEDMVKALSAEVLLITSRQVGRPLEQLAPLVARERNSPCRLTIGFGNLVLSPDLIQKLLDRIPCISVGGHHLALKEVMRSIRMVLPRSLPKQAASCALNAIRVELLKHAYASRDHLLFKEALTWTTWSWLGKPLFATAFIEIEQAAYPHLMNLRSIASRDWYFERSKDIPDLYQAESLVAKVEDPDKKFHLYLSGAGGTGKSCFLKYVYETCAINRPDVLPIWYKVDAPSSEWENIEKRVKEEVVATIKARKGGDTNGILPELNKDLGVYLMSLVANLRKSGSEINEVILFIDQLERTFESGDNPEEYRLIRISRKFINLLKTVGVGKGVRVFIASRKQYLPDFLGSSESAYENSLHFNVLQKISDSNEQVDFVQTVLGWCKKNNLVDRSVEIDEQASKELADAVEGHPLNMMLVLIQLFSQDRTGLINKERLLQNEHPWEQLFLLDEQLAAKDELDWYFILAMAHARTEIVRFEEVWWRLRMVEASITERANELGPQEMLERLWLFGHLGRTLFARPSDEDPAKFLEFFHANLRDHLISDVMNYGGEELRIKGAKGGTPPAWKAMDRLSAVARDWKQSQQLLQRDDVQVLMDHKDVFVEPIQKEGGSGDVEAFYLLFLRDTQQLRDQLFQAARECFVYSAIVHDILGRWAFKKLIPDIDKQVSHCINWLKRCDKDSRLKLLQYLIELRSPKGDHAISDLIFNRTQADLEDVWEQIANILSEPLFASRYRDRLVAYFLEYLNEKKVDFPADNDPSDRFGAFCAATCNGDRNELFSLMGKIVDRVAGLNDERLQGMTQDLLADEARLEEWLKRAETRGVDVSISSREIHNVVPPAIELRAGDQLRGSIDDTLVKTWHDVICGELGLPLPEFKLTFGETSAHDEGEDQYYLEGYEVELRLDGQRVSLGDFYPGMRQTLRRHWALKKQELPAGSKKAHNEALQEAVVWVGEKDLKPECWQKSECMTFEQAVQSWTHLNLRKHIARAFKFDSLVDFMNDVFSSAGTRLSIHEFQRIVSTNFHALWRVFVNLSRENVPIAGRRVDLMVELQRLVRENSEMTTTILTQKLRELVSTEICRTFLDSSNRLPVLLLDSGLEDELIKRIRISRTEHRLDLNLDLALRVAASIRRRFEELLRKEDVRAVLVCEDDLRLPLFRLVQHFDTRIFVLSFTELSPDIQLLSRGIISGISMPEED